MSGWRWLPIRAIHAVHDRQLAEHGGGTGIRDLPMLESALARAQNLASYGEPDAAALAAAYAFGLAKNHPYVDGNKRTAWIAARLFLSWHGIAISFDKAEATVAMQQLAGGDIGEDEFAAWLRARITDA